MSLSPYLFTKISIEYLNVKLESNIHAHTHTHVCVCNNIGYLYCVDVISVGSKHQS